MAVIESQICGIKTIISGAIPKDAIISSKTEQLLLTDGINMWQKKSFTILFVINR